jgi:protein DGCR14
MTWGTLLSTPRPLDESASSSQGDLDLAPNAFKISEPKRRDTIGRRLAGDASRAMRERARGFGTAPRGLAVLSSDRPSPGRLGSMGPPRTPSSAFTTSTPRRTAESLTPAGRDLLRRTAVTPLSASRSSALGLQSAGSRSRGDAMERAGGWGDLGKRRATRPPADRTW